MEPAWTDNTVSWLAIRAARCPTETATAELASAVMLVRRRPRGARPCWTDACGSGPETKNPARSGELPGLPSVRPWRACHVLRAHRGFAGATHRRRVITPQGAFDPRLTLLVCSSPTAPDPIHRPDAASRRSAPFSPPVADHRSCRRRRWHDLRSRARQRRLCSR